MQRRVDSSRPPGSASVFSSACAYATQARRWLTRALEAEVADCDLTEREAIHLATRLMRGNQLACFDLEGTRAAIRGRIAPES